MPRPTGPAPNWSVKQLPAACLWHCHGAIPPGAPAPLTLGIRPRLRTMGVEEAVLYVVAELPCLAVAWLLKRFAGWPDKKADNAAPLICIALLLAACFSAWWLYATARPN